ncbi:uncharacterized protein C8R40DRAFT_252575 [Lentinula edodes]|uniref:uncharacterized protein n=1 Tax=Lentinula edodes TaxID=5353 RepID=UPI001E8D2F64|nr:uncharacterized protein C8R40DRAFT_252575 [Lentinula edodes]KAH7880427.1 hypothetical protein C8R40DRAFT_252575 [Lentinula edodes]
MSFQCSNADFHVRSVHDNELFAVRRQALCSSEVFRDMFTCCGESEETLDLHETADSLAALLILLHHPPQPPTKIKRDKYNLIPKVWNDPKTVIPLPLLPRLFELADKYALPPDSVTEVLGEHLLAHASEEPLTVYVIAHSQELHRIASQASQFLQPMANYSLHEVKAIPIEAYHRFVQLQDTRVKAMRKYLLSEDIFPHGYGICASHSRETTQLWHSKRMSLAVKVETLTDVAGEMEIVVYQEPVQSCAVCRKACIAAVEMLRYKCRKIPRTVDKLNA